MPVGHSQVNPFSSAGPLHLLVVLQEQVTSLLRENETLRRENETLRLLAKTQKEKHESSKQDLDRIGTPSLREVEGQADLNM